jgi:hypothetical protein
MRCVDKLRRISSWLLAFGLLVTASDVVIFHRAGALTHLKALADRVPPRVNEFGVAILIGLVLLGLVAVMRRAASIFASFARYLWAADEPASDALDPKDRHAAEDQLRANRIQVITTIVQALGGIAVLIGLYFAWANLRTTQEAQKDTQKTQEQTLQITNKGKSPNALRKQSTNSGLLTIRVNPVWSFALGEFMPWKASRENHKTTTGQSWKSLRPTFACMRPFKRLRISN